MANSSATAFSYLRLFATATGGILVGLVVGNYLQNNNNVNEIEDDNRDRNNKLHPKINSLKSELKNANIIIDTMVKSLRKRIDAVNLQNLELSEALNLKTSMISSNNQQFDHLLDKITEKLHETLQLYDNASEESKTLKQELSNCQAEVQRLKELIMNTTNNASMSLSQLPSSSPPFGHTPFSWAGNNFEIKVNNNDLPVIEQRKKEMHLRNNNNNTDELDGEEDITKIAERNKKAALKQIAMSSSPERNAFKYISNEKMLSKSEQKAMVAKEKRFTMMGNVFNTAVRLQLAEDLKAVFQKLDNTNKDFLTKQDVKDGILKMKLNHIIHNDIELDELWIALDIDCDNKISFQDFETFCNSH